ncbi:MAG TPA: hypothetical protein VLB45_04445 [Nitrosopumilaceae archaeon]|nr:hypothetical protein [Nitrosopumilaceae archaeon]
MKQPTNNLRIATLTAIAAILLIPSMQGTQVFAEEKAANSNSVNDITLKAVFDFRSGVKEKVDTFKNYKPFVQTGTSTTSGFDTTRSAPKLVLEKVMGADTPYLYQAVDITHNRGKSVQHEYQEFDMAISWIQGNTPIRQIFYTDCNVADYFIYTEFDKEETYNEKTKFVYLDSFTFECRGLEYGNPVYHQILDDKVTQEKAVLKAAHNKK